MGASPTPSSTPRCCWCRTSTTTATLPTARRRRLLVQNLYNNRDAADTQKKEASLYGFDLLLKNYMVLTGGTPIQVERDGLIDKLTVVQTEFDFDFGEIEDPTDELIEAYDTQRRNMAALYNRYAFIQQPTTYICQKFREAIAKAKEDCDEIINRQNE